MNAISPWRPAPFLNKEAQSSSSAREYQIDEKVSEMKLTMREALEDLRNEAEKDSDVKMPDEKLQQDVYDFLVLIPEFEVPLISAFHDGSIVLQWSNKPHATGSLLIFFYGDGLATYTAKFDKERSRGTATLLPGKVPDAISIWLRNFIDKECKWIVKVSQDIGYV